MPSLLLLILALVRASELVTDFTMGSASALVARSQSNCPHLEAGLVDMSETFPSTAYSDIVNIRAYANLVIRAGMNVLLTPSPTNWMDGGVFKRIDVYGTLVFDDKNMTISVAEIRVHPGGALKIGSPTCRLKSYIVVTFTGSKKSSSLAMWDTSSPTSTSKGIMSKGLVDIHGFQYQPTWTRLRTTAEEGDTTITLRDSVNWEIGQKVYIATSAWYDCPAKFQKEFCKDRPAENEVRRIVALSVNNTVIQLDTPLKFNHYAGDDYQVEVALMSRRITLTGGKYLPVRHVTAEALAEEEGFGGHVVVTGPGVGRFSGIGAENMGQLNVLGRYPLHFHCLNDGSTSYVQDSAVLSSNFRAVTIHNTDGVRLSRNVAVDIMGHAFYLESGTEQLNLLEYNFVAHTIPLGARPAGAGSGWSGNFVMYHSDPKTLINPSDTAASAFYVLNAFNRFVGNSVSGGWAGFLFVNVDKPVFEDEAMHYEAINPSSLPLLEFLGNTVHSVGYYWPEHGPAIYVGGNLAVLGVVNGTHDVLYNLGRTARETVRWQPMVFNHTKIFLTNKGLLHWGTASSMVNYEIHDFVGDSVFVFGRSGMHNALIVGYSRDNIFNGAYSPARAMGYDRTAITFYDTVSMFIVTAVTFRNFGTHDRIFGMLDTSDHYTPQTISAVAGIAYDNVNGARFALSKRHGQAGVQQSVLDYDGSASLLTGSPQIIGGSGGLWEMDDECVIEPSSNYVHRCAWTSNRMPVFIQFLNPVVVPDGCPPGFAGCDDQGSKYGAGYFTYFGGASPRETLTLWGGMSAPGNTGWYMRLDAGAPDMFLIHAIQVPRGNFVVLALSYPAGASFSVTLTQRHGPAMLDYPHADSLDSVLAPTQGVAPGQGAMWFFDGAHLYLRVVNPSCYLGGDESDEWCTGDGITFNYYGQTLWSVNRRWRINVNVTSCDGCKVVNSVGERVFYSAPDKAPAPFKVVKGKVVTVSDIVYASLN
jgi:hypothetical protein